VDDVNEGNDWDTDHEESDEQQESWPAHLANARRTTVA
jgi:hypothetical protein